MKRAKIVPILTAGLLLAFGWQASAAEFDVKDADVTISGTAVAGQDVTVKITDEGSEYIQLDSQTAAADGGYRFSVALPILDSSKVYTIRVNGVVERQITVLSLEDVVKEFEKATAEGMPELITTYARRLNLELSKGYDKLNAKDKVIEMFLKCPRTTKDEICTNFARCVAVQLVNEADRSTVSDVLKANETVLGIDFESVGAFSKTKYEAFVIALLKEDYADYTYFLSGFNNAISQAEDTDEPKERPSSPGGGGGGGRPSSVGGMVSVPSVEPVENSGEAPGEMETNAVFNDLQSVEWAKPHIERLYEKGVISGRGDGSFAPQDTVTREEFVAMIVRMFGLSAAKDNAGFTDVPADSWSRDAISAAVENGVVSGVTETEFGFGSPVTRQDCAVICARILQNYNKFPQKVSSGKFADDETIADYARDAVYAMKEMGVLNGMDGNSFQPNSTCTRAMAAKMIDLLGGCVEQ